jgi:hypothetical protein
MSRWLICIVAMLFAGQATAADITALEIVEYGLFRARTTGYTPSPQAVDERTNSLADVVFYSATAKVPARQGIRFGASFRVVGAPANQVVTLRSVWRIPEPGIRNPETGILYRESVSDTATTIGTVTMRGYTFDAAWEIRCGDWTLEIWFGERRLLSQTFTVEDCRGAPTAARRAAARAG